MTEADANYYTESRSLLEDAYVADEREDVAGGSGSSSGLANWEPKRRLIADAFDHAGTWLDVGCANGLLMHTLTQWTEAKGVHIEPYGLDLSARIAHRARLRYPQWANRIWTGNVMMWAPPFRFDYVTLLPEYVPANRFAGMIDKVSRTFLNPGGRLVVSSYFGTRPNGAPPLKRASELLYDIGIRAKGQVEVTREDGSLWTSCGWFDA